MIPVCTALISRIFDPKGFKSAIAKIAAGMETENVIPANKPKYAFAALEEIE